MKNVLITGSAGLIGSEAAKFFAQRDFQIVGVDNNMRSYFLGKEGDTDWVKESIKRELKKQYIHYSVDIRDNNAIKKIFKKHKKFEIIIHAAAQPSHDWAVREPLTDFAVNTNGTLVLLENFRLYSPRSVFIYTSTSKVYGDRPNSLPLQEFQTRFDLPKKHRYYNGIDESMSIDDSKHSLFGASKLSADILVQEYGKYFNLKTVSFRCGCLTGSAHSSSQLHGFLAYLVRCAAIGKKYTIFGYKGKQVRDNLHSFDLVNAFYHFYRKPRIGAIYNIGGSRYSNISILEAIKRITYITRKKLKYEYIGKPRIGDHIWYISDMTKFKSHYPAWNVAFTSDQIIEEIYKNGNF